MFVSTILGDKYKPYDAYKVDTIYKTEYKHIKRSKEREKKQLKEGYHASGGTPLLSILGSVIVARFPFRSFPLLLTILSLHPRQD